MAKLTSQYLVNGFQIYMPAAFAEESQESIISDESGRTLDGVMHVFWKRRKLSTFSLKYDHLAASEFEYMRGLLQGQDFQFTFWHNGSERTIHAYCTGNTGSLQSINGEGVYRGVAFNITEM